MKKEKKTEPPKKISEKKEPNIFIKHISIFFICSWIFFVGVLVGRGFSPVKFDINRLRQDLITLQKKMLESEHSQMKSEKDSEIPNNIDFYEELKKTETETSIKTDIPIQKRKPISAEDVLKKEEKPSEKIDKAEKPEKIDIKKNTSVELNNKINEKAIDKKIYAVQIASVNDSDAADKLIEKLKKKGYSAYRIEAKSDNKTWYRVRIGPFEDKMDAEKNFNSLKDDKYNPLLITITK
ncbi:MAG: SPOR domain-containing protein [Desulfobacterales bacterium]|nr:SPOR domain-containing protein [Desulfobacterales bacterium]